MKKAFILTLWCICLSVSAQHIEIFEPALLEVEYNKRMVRDTLDRENDYISDAVRLRIGKETSMFYSPKELWYDSLSCNQELKTQVFLQYSRSKGKLSAPAGFYKERVYKNHPVGKITVFNRFDLCIGHTQKIGKATMGIDGFYQDRFESSLPTGNQSI